MSEATEYLLENYKKTFEIEKAIAQMEEEVLKKFDKAIRQAFPDWISGNWICTDEENLAEDYCINIIRKEWSFKSAEEETNSYIWTYLTLNGDAAFWSFLGLPTEDDENWVKVIVDLRQSFKALNGFKGLIKEFDRKNEKLLEENGFKGKGGDANRWYEMPVKVAHTSLLKGLRDGDWDEATSQLQQAWQCIEKIEWGFLKDAIKVHSKSSQDK